MISFEQFKASLQGTPLAGKNLVRLDVPQTGDEAWAIEVDQRNALPAWQLLRSRVAETGRWPVLVASWSGPIGDWSTSIARDNLFNRWPFEQELGRSSSAPRDIIEESKAVTELDKVLLKRAGSDGDDAEEAIDDSLDETRARVGRTPDLAEIEKLIGEGSIASRADLERWLFRWELRNGSVSELTGRDAGYLRWFEPRNQPMALVLLPTPNSWEALAYMHWFGAELHGSPAVIAALREWNARYGAELVAHYGTMLHLVTSKLPATPDEAFHLAWQQERLAPCTTILPGVSLRHHARVLMKLDRWFLHERP